MSARGAGRISSPLERPVVAYAVAFAAVAVVGVGVAWGLFLPQDRAAELWRAGRIPLGLLAVAGGLAVWLAAALARALKRGAVLEARLRTLQAQALDPFAILEPVRAGRQSRDDFKRVAETAAVMAWMSGPQLGAVWFNPAWLAFTGQPLSAELGRGWVEGVDPDDLDRLLAAYALAFERREPLRITYRLRDGQGRRRWLDETAVPTFDPDGTFTGYAGACLDVTEQRIAEQTLSSGRAQEDLQAAVAERTRALEASLEERARTEASLAQARRLETMGQLTGGVAHDFNNLLTVIIGGLDMILRRPDDTERVVRLAEAALAAGKRGERLTRQLLTFARRQELKPEVVDVAQLIAQVDPLVRRTLGDEIALTMELAPDVGAARLDPAQFEAALLNLVVNAADAVGESGRVTIRARRLRLAEGEVQGARAGAYVAVSVSDTGPGMTPEVVQRAFEPFFTTKEVGKGAGLGLAQVYGFITQCGGAAAIDSRPGHGTIVTLYMPAAAPMAEPAKAPEVEPALGAHVLLVEDDEAVRALTETLLIELGCQVTVAPDAARALERLSAGEQFDLMLSDIAMPGGMSGVELAHAAADRAPNLPIVLTTGYAGDRFGDGADVATWPVLRKPFRADQLEAMVRDVLAGANES